MCTTEITLSLKPQLWFLMCVEQILCYILFVCVFFFSSIMNSLVIVLFLSGMVAMIMLRTLHKDIARYNQVDQVKTFLSSFTAVSLKKHL